MTRIIQSSHYINAIWTTVGAFISRGVSFISIAWIARILGPDIFGEYNVVQTTVGLFGTVSGLGLGLAATKLIAEWRGRDIHKVSRIIGTLYFLSFFISVIVSIILFVTSGWVSSNVLKNDNLVLILRITSVIIILDAMNGIQNGVLTGFESFKEIAIINTFVGILSAPMLIVATYFYGLTGLIIMLLICRGINVMVNSIYLKKEYKHQGIIVKPHIEKDVLKLIFGISIPSFLSSLSTNPINWIATTIFVNQPYAYSALGTYNAANQLKTLVLFLPESAGKVTIPRLAITFGNGELKKFKSTITITFFTNLVLSMLTAIVLYLFVNIFQQFIGLKFFLSNELILTVLATGVLIAITNAIGYIFICSNLIWYDFWLRIVWGIALILLIYFFGRYNGAVGYGISILGAYIVNLIAQVIVLFVKFWYIFKK